MTLFVKGRKQVFPTLKNQLDSDDRVIWIHAASLGEYEQAVPIIGALKKNFPRHKIVLTFFSPSGYEVKKNSSLADVVTYLPLDTKRNAKKFIEQVSPEFVLFIKYEVWPNYLFQLSKRHIPALLIAGVFRDDQIYFKFYGKFLRKALRQFNHIFVQERKSKKVLEAYDFLQVSVSGDTRYDRVIKQLSMDNQLDFAKTFLDGSLAVVCGSTWPEDEAYLLPFINQLPKDVKVIVAPHQIKAEKIKRFREKLAFKSICYSEREGQNLSDFQVLIVDTVGLLTKIYSYAHIAYVGGAAGTTGLHNVLEPAAFGVPVVIGGNHQKFPEAAKLEAFGGLFSVSSAKGCSDKLHELTTSSDLRENSGRKAATFIENHRGATQKTMKFILAHFKS